MKPISDNFYSLIPFFQETIQLESFVDENLSKTHQDKKLPLLVSIISEWMSKNSDLLSGKSPQEIGEIFIDWYRDHFFSWIQQDQSYQMLRSKIIGKVSSNFSSVEQEKIDNELEMIIRKQAKKHSIYIECALEKILKKAVNLHSLPDHYSSRSLKNVSLDAFFT